MTAAVGLGSVGRSTVGEADPAALGVVRMRNRARTTPGAGAGGETD